jgi:hypothetical protein
MTNVEGYPIWGYHCIVAHNRQFLEWHSWNGVFRGNTNDNAMVRDSLIIIRLCDDPMFAGHGYTLVPGEKPPNDLIAMNGAHGINDGGYQCGRPNTIVSPKSFDALRCVLGQYQALSECMKYAECAFDIFKWNERILRVPILIRKNSHVENIFRTCVALNNMLLQFDNLDSIGEFQGNYIDVRFSGCTTQSMSVSMPKESIISNIF